MAVERDREGVFRGSCINHPPHRFGACEKFVLMEGTSKCRTCGCVARSHVAYGPCTRHSCGGYDQLSDVEGECCNCGCAPSVHRVINTSSLQPSGSHAASVTAQGIPSSSTLTASTVSVSEGRAGEDNNVWQQIQHLAKTKRNQQLDANPPKRQGRKPSGGRGGPRPNSGRKRSIPKEVTVTPVKLVSRRLGKYQAKGPKEFVSLVGVDGGVSGLTLKTLEDVFLRHFLSFTRDEAMGVYQFCILKTLRGPRLSMDNHITGKQFYFYWNAGFEMESDEEEDTMMNEIPELPADDPEPVARSLLPPVNPPAVQWSLGDSTSVPAILPIPVRSSVALSKRATDIRRRVQLKGLMQQVPNTLPVRPSAVLNLGKSIALPATKLTEFPVAITAFAITSDWSSIKTEGPLHCVLDVRGFPAEPFSSGTFQHAFKASCIVPNKYLELGTKYVLKQQRIEGQINEETSIESLSTEAIDTMDAECEKKSAKVCQISAVANALCQHHNILCRQIADYGEEIRVLPSVFAKMGGQFPSCATIEPEIDGTWQKFMNNDGLEIGDGQDNFRLKALAFAHWTFNKFGGKLLVCDLQGANYHLSDLEIASTDERLFGIGNLSSTALEGFKSTHQCNIYCVAMDLPGFDILSANADNHDGNQDPTSPEVLTLSSVEDESLPSLMTLVASKKMESQTSADAGLSISNDKLGLDCGICLTNKIDVMFYQCGHIYCCENCAVKLNGNCPICRIKYDKLVKIYLV